MNKELLNLIEKTLDTLSKENPDDYKLKYFQKARKLKDRMLDYATNSKLTQFDYKQMCETLDIINESFDDIDNLILKDRS